MSEQPRCPECGRTLHARRHTLYRAERAPWWMRLLNAAGATFPTQIERQAGFVVTCQAPKCNATYGIGDGGPNDVWKLDAKLADPRGDVLREIVQQTRGEREPKVERDPADGLMMRKERE